MKARLITEFLGTAGLLIVVVGSGIMGESLAQGNAAIALLANALATGAGLYALIQVCGPISGAHFNPAVSFAEWYWKRLSSKDFCFYSMTQVLGGVVGVLLTHAMFGESLFQLSRHDRSDMRFLLSESIATFGLIAVIGVAGRKQVKPVAGVVAAYIIAAYWCTSSTSFANPAVTIARSLTDTFSGITWTGVPGFICAQIVGAFAAASLLWKEPNACPKP